LVRYLAALGHTRIARVEGVEGFFHSVQRSTAFLEVAATLGVTATVVSTDYTPESGVRATRRLLSEPEPPTAIAFDSPTLGVSGLGVALQMGLGVPEDLSLIAWDDSLICQVVHPPLTTLTRDITAFGSAACRHLRAVIETPGRVGHLETPRAELTARASTGPAPAGSRNRRRKT
jgi:DNA-binding LacI/PurR family transcriptional regulator